MKRSNIKGFTIKILKYNIEFVTIKHLLKTIAIYKNNNRQLIKRFEF